MFLMGLEAGNIKVCLCSPLDINAKEGRQMCSVTDDVMPLKQFSHREPEHPPAGVFRFGLFHRMFTHPVGAFPVVSLVGNK